MGLMDKAKDAMSNEQTSDKVLDKGEQLADKKTGGTHDAQIEKGVTIADKKLGNQ